jgi:hypothetical protein
MKSMHRKVSLTVIIIFLFYFPYFGKVKGGLRDQLAARVSVFLPLKTSERGVT